ncbi:MAG: hypothetical protein JJLCMIEE_02847 [Acidimicrobiales bacterium]|nr:MAG: DUF2510 domain-containing protein [Actinomycetota bacterium]MBV6509749.1 hypothetical protein [Acidimicrobiales bacterium]RIK04857.1 MAG: hypothetical protein DCC48_12525 [Acidobacteriota bacterium]
MDPLQLAQVETPVNHTIATAIGVVLTLVLLWIAFISLSRKWRVDDVPTSKVAGAFIGENEVTGVAESDNPLIGVFTGRSCFWYRYKEERRTDSVDTHDDRSGRWTKVRSGERMIPFRIRDDTGAMWVRPKGAEFNGGETRVFTRGDRRYTETALRLNEPTYVIGPVRWSDDAPAPFFTRSPDSARDLYMIARGTDRQVSHRMGWLGYGVALQAVALAVITPFLGYSTLETTAGESTIQLRFVTDGRVGLAAIFGGVVIGLLLLSYLTHLYNRLVASKNRTGMAWSMIDVQLQRRTDLIGNLVEVVRGYTAYERRVLEAIAYRRSCREVPTGADISTADRAYAGQQGVTKELVALAEAYPDLRAAASYQSLLGALADTEDRVAWARSFYNDTVTVLRDRVRTFPGILLAPLVRPGSRELFRIGADERVVPRVDLSDRQLPWAGPHGDDTGPPTGDPSIPPPAGTPSAPSPGGGWAAEDPFSSRTGGISLGPYEERTLRPVPRAQNPSPPEGWYPDPVAKRDRVRFWSGRDWTVYVKPGERCEDCSADAPPPEHHQRVAAFEEPKGWRSANASQT